MVAAAQSLLTSNPDDISMLILLADTWCNDTAHLDKAAAYAQHALDLLAAAKKPDNVDDAQWQKQVALQKGLAYSSLGEVDVNKNRNPQAVDAFKQASPLLKSDNFSYAQNQYRLGFTLAKMQRIPEARVVLTRSGWDEQPLQTARAGYAEQDRRAGLGKTKQEELLNSAEIRERHSGIRLFFFDVRRQIFSRADRTCRFRLRPSLERERRWRNQCRCLFLQRSLGRRASAVL